MKIEIPITKINFRPAKSANFPTGIKKIQHDSKYVVGIQVSSMASTLNSDCIAGSATFIDDAMKGVSKDAIMATKKTAFFVD